MNHELRIMNHDENKKIKSFTDLNAWQEGHKLVVMVYKVTKNFPQAEQFGLTNQLRRASASITSNIAEGFSRQSYKEKLQFYSMALGSLTEVQNQILISKDVGFLSKEEFSEISQLTIIVSRIVNGLIKSTKSIILNS